MQVHRQYFYVNRRDVYMTKSGSVNVPARLRDDTSSYTNQFATFQGSTLLAYDALWASAAHRALPAGLVNRTVEALRGKVSDPAQMGVFLAEAKESFEMISRRAVTLRKAFNALRRFDLPSVARHLAIPRDVQRDAERRISKKHYVTANWLEYWLGWAPMVSDIGTAVDVLQRPSFSDRSIKVARSESVGRADLIEWGIPAETSSQQITFGLYGTFGVSNPNVYLADQLGFTNPASIAWELVPFSFIANWFVNVDSFLGNLNAYAGLNIKRSGHFHKVVSSGSIRRLQNWPPNWEPGIESGSFSSTYFSRQASAFPNVSLRAEWPRLSHSRAATSISLLTQLFLKP